MAYLQRDILFDNFFDCKLAVEGYFVWHVDDLVNVWPLKRLKHKMQSTTSIKREISQHPVTPWNVVNLWTLFQIAKTDKIWLLVLYSYANLHDCK